MQHPASVPCSLSIIRPLILNWIPVMLLWLSLSLIFWAVYRHKNHALHYSHTVLLLTLCTVTHATLCGLEQVNIEVSTVSDSDWDAKHAALFAAAREKLPCSAGCQLPDLQRPWQGLTLTQRQPHRGLSPTVVYLDVWKQRGNQYVWMYYGHSFTKRILQNGGKPVKAILE